MQKLDKYIIDIDEYEQKSIIGEGASGSVYIYTNKKTHKKYAGKVLKNFKEKDFFREIQIQLIDHPAILKLQGFKATIPAIILTDYMENGSLDKKIEDKSLNPTQKQIILYGVAKGIEYLHSNQIFHRDLKPGNILLDENLYPKISDFGLSKFTDSSVKLQSRICGTPKYYAPEVMSGRYGTNADIFSFGIILYEVITEDIKNISNDFNNDKLSKEYHKLIINCTSDVIQERPNINYIINFLCTHLLDNVNKQEFDDYAMIVNKFKPEGKNIDQANEAYEKALQFMKEKNFIKAGKFFEISAENGNSDAMYQYSQLLFDGKGVPQDIHKSYSYLKRAADDNNNVDAQYKLAFIYLDMCAGKKPFEDIEEGEDTPEYYIKEAAKYMRLVADSGNPQAQYKYSMMLSEGYGVHKDESKRKYYLKLAATNENPDIDALIELGTECLKEDDNASAEKYFQIAADKLESPVGQYYYGMMHLRNCKKKSESAKNAAEYIQKAAENDDENNSVQKMAQNLYGVCLYEGIGMNKSEKEAMQYFEKAASKDYPPAIFNIGLIQEKKILSQISKKMNQSQSTQTNAGSSPISSPKSQPAVNLKSKSSMQCLLMEKEQMKKLDEPLKNFKNAADLGCPEAADYYATVNDNIRIKEEYFSKAAKKGNYHAQYMLADLYCDVIQDKKNMNKYLQLAASQKYMPALIMLAEQNEKNGKIKDAIKYYQMVADQDFNQEKDRNIEIISAYHDGIKFNEKNKNDAILASLEKLAFLLSNGKPEIKNVEIKDVEMAKIYAEKGKQLGSIPCIIVYAKLTNDIEMMKEVADKNDKNAKYEYAKLVFKLGRVDECINYLENAAEQHNDAACMELVSLYERCNLFGEKFTKYKNMKKSKYFCQIAVDDDYPQALTKLGLDYLCGFGCKKDIQKAKEFFKKAIDKGNDEIALFNYADILMKERNNTSDALKKNELYKEALDYYKESAIQNSPQGQFRYACLVLEILQKKELDELNNELTDSQNDDFNDHEINHKTVDKYLKSSAKQNYPPAFLKYSDYLLDYKKDTKTGLKYLKKAAEKDDKAKFKYGKILYDGYYIKDSEDFVQDQKNGLIYIKQAAENKFKEAEEFLESIKGKSESSSKMLPEKK